MAHPKPASPNEPKTADEAPAAAAAAGKETPIEAAAAASSPAVESPLAKKSDDTTTAAAEEPTYFTTRSSSAYATARKLLNMGQFEDALQLIEAAMMATRQRLPPLPTGEEDEFHPSLAPLYYLYGTTLLYSVEESDDMVNGSAASAQGAGNGPAASEDMAEDLQIAWENLDLARTIMEARGLVGDDEMELVASSSSAATSADSNADGASNKKAEPESARTLLLDLSQIHLRLADLQKANSSYRDCIADYAKALELRQMVLGPYDRKVADVHYQLGVVCMTRAAEGDRAEVNGGGGGEDDTAGAGAGASTGAAAGAGAAAAGASSGLLPPGAAGGILGMMAAAAEEAAAAAEEETKPSPEECRELRERSVRHYLACARCFGGCVAKLCGVVSEEEIEEMVGKMEAVEGAFVGGGGSIVAEGDKKMPAVQEEEDEGKKMGNNDAADADANANEHQTYVSASKTLADIRAKCSELANAKKPASATSTTTVEENMEVVAEILSLLDELQETIDSQEEDLRGVHEVHEMKAKIEEEVKAADANPFANAPTVNADGSVETIGFGAPSSAAAGAVGAVGAATGAAGSSTGEPARPMMVVKKKKKRAALAPADGTAAAASATPAAAVAKPAAEAAKSEPDSKRAKTE